MILFFTQKFALLLPPAFWPLDFSLSFSTAPEWVPLLLNDNQDHPTADISLPNIILPLKFTIAQTFPPAIHYSFFFYRWFNMYVLNTLFAKALF